MEKAKQLAIKYWLENYDQIYKDMEADVHVSNAILEAFYAGYNEASMDYIPKMTNAEFDELKKKAEISPEHWEKLRELRKKKN